MRKSLLFFLISVTNICAFAQSLSGTYTINPNLAVGSGNYQSFTALANDLNTYGISGPVYISVAPGTYMDSLHLRNVRGTSASNTIVIDGQDSSSTILEHSGKFAGANVSATVVLDGSEFIHIKNLGILNNDSSRGVAIYMSGACKNNTFSRCDIKVNPLSRPDHFSYRFFNIFSQNSRDTFIHIGNNRIIENRISGGYFGVNIEGNSNSIKGNEISDNVFENILRTGIYCSYQDSLIIKGNLMDLPLHADISSVVGVRIEQCSNIKISQNKIRASSGISLSSFSGSVELFNNMVIGGVNGIDVSNYRTNSSRKHIYHNSVHAFDFALTIISDSGSGSIDIKNNIFSSEKKSAVSLFSADSLKYKMDNNIYYSRSPYLLRVNRDLFKTLADLNQVLPQWNASSIEMNPNFINDTANLYFLESFAYARGDTTLNINVDIDGNPRNSRQGVCMGAYEFKPPSNNATVVAWEQDPLCAGANSPSVEIANLGSDSLHTILVKYSINGYLDSVLYSNPIPPSEKHYVQLSPVQMIADSTYQLMLYSSMPNGMPDDLPETDTLFTLLRSGLSGNYSINKKAATKGKNFNSFEELATIMQQHGVCGVVDIEVAAGTGPYQNQFTLEGIPGSSSFNQVYINGNNEIIQHKLLGATDHRGVINLKNTSFLTIDSLQIKMNGSDSLNGKTKDEIGCAIHVMNGSHHLTISNCTLEVDSFNIESAGILFYNDDLAQDYMSIKSNAYACSIQNNKIIRKNPNNISSGIFFHYLAENANSAGLSSSNEVSSNEIENYHYGVILKGMDSLKLEKNLIKNYNGGNGINITAANSILYGNEIRESSSNMVGFADPTIGKSYFINNLIYSTAYYTALSVGLGCSNCVAYNNTISMTDSTYKSFVYRVVGIQYGGESVCINNQISISGADYVENAGLLQAELSLSGPHINDYNNFHLSTKGFGAKYFGAHLNIVGGITGYSTLAAWQNASGKDIHSMSIDPQFTDPAAGDFTPQNPFLVGTPLPQVTEDMYGTRRGSIPTIGAIERHTPVGIMEESGSTLIIFPNPSNGIFTLVAIPARQENFHLSLWDMSGKRLYNKEFKAVGSQIREFDFSFLPKGIYMIKLATKRITKTEKLIIH